MNLSITTTIVGIALSLAIAFGAYQYGSAAKTHAEAELIKATSQAVDGCGELALSVIKDEFIEYTYNLCLKDKDLK